MRRVEGCDFLHEGHVFGLRTEGGLILLFRLIRMAGGGKAMRQGQWNPLRWEPALRSWMASSGLTGFSASGRSFGSVRAR